MIFLQKGQKAHKFKRKNVLLEDFNIAESVESMVFPEDSTEITFEMFDIFKNKTIHVIDWFLFMTFSYNYMQLTPLGVQRLNWDVLQTHNLSGGDYDVFQFDQDQQSFKTRVIV